MRVPIGARVGRYRVEGLLGSGGMGEVYRARDEELDRPVALKLLPETLRKDEDFQRRLRSEARAASALNHPNILTVYEIGEADGEHFIATEFVDGVTLRTRIGEIELLDVIRIAEAVAEALTAAEGAGILHRDIKPENIMIRSDGYVKVLDFGLARRLPTSEPSYRTESQALRGTLFYMSPEQLRGQPLDSRTDVWSLGVLLFELTTGRRPFDGATASDVIAAVVGSALPTGSAPSVVEPILTRALQKDATHRYASMRTMWSDLKSLRQRLETGSTELTSTLVNIEPGGGEGEAMPLPALPRRRRSNLPVLLTPLLGREREVEAIKTLLGHDAVRLITLTGPGGTGKTRLALQVALESIPIYEEGVIFVSLASVSEARLVPDAIAKALGIPEDAGGSPTESIKREVTNEEMLLILDNLEQVVDCGLMLVDLLESAPGLKILTTSQASLRLRGEFEYPVPPLEVPEANGSPDPERLAANGAVALFVDRARAIEPRFELTSANAAPVAEICRRLEGLPLAIELAAARIRLMSPKAILARLGKRLELLTGGSRDLPSRQQTMTATIAWGYNLLTGPDKRLLARLSVFEGGATLEGAEEVCIAPYVLDVGGGLETLVNRSFLRREEDSEGEVRFVMLSTIREYGLQRLLELGEGDAVRDAHAGWCLRFAEEAKLRSNEQVRWTARVDHEHANLQAALSWSVAQGDRARALGLAGAMWWFWYLRGYYAVGRRWLEEALDMVDRDDTAGPDSDETLRAPALAGAGVLAFLQCDYDHAVSRLDEAARIASATGDRETLATAAQFLGGIARERGSYERSLELHRQALEYWRELGNRSGIARSLNYIGFASWLSGDCDLPQMVCREALSIFKQAADDEGMVWSKINLAAAAQCQGELELAMRLSKDSLTTSREAGFKEGVAWSLNILGVVSRRRGQPERAEGFLRTSFDFHWDLGDRWRMASVLEALAGLRVDAADYSAAALLFGAAAALREAIGTPVAPSEKAELDTDLARTREALGEQFAAQFTRGRSTPVHRILDS